MNDNDLKEVLKAAGLAVLPEPLSDRARKVWLKAIVRVEKIGCAGCYAIAENAGGGQVSFKRIFGPSGMVTRIISIHPYDFMEKRFQPILRSDNDYRTYLIKGKVPASVVDPLFVTDGKSADEQKADRAKIKALVETIAIREANMKLDEEERCRQIMNYGKGTEAKD